MAQRTPFYQHHVNLGAKIVDFAGWDMPIQYTTITLEHNAVRTHAGLFDISHMGQVFVWGPDSEAYLQNLVTNDLRKATPGKGIYAHLLNERGGVIDDIFVYRLDDEKFLVIVNASRRDVDTAWMNSHKSGFDVTLTEAPYAAGLALQGPSAVDMIAKLSPDAARLPRFGIGDFPLLDVSSLVARTGYTGEDGFEFFAPAGHMLQIWDMLFNVGKGMGLVAAGLGARDTLRTEAAYPLYGHELDENHTPFEAGLDWVVKMDKGTFIGRDALAKQKAAGLKVKLRGFKVGAGGVARPGGKILLNGTDVGEVASGTFAPTLNAAIGMAYLPTHVTDGSALTIMQGTRSLSATVVPLPFYKKPLAVK
jgi:aminomethyltransferase